GNCPWLPYERIHEGVNARERSIASSLHLVLVVVHLLPSVLGQPYTSVVLRLFACEAVSDLRVQEGDKAVGYCGVVVALPSGHVPRGITAGRAEDQPHIVQAVPGKRIREPLRAFSKMVTVADAPDRRELAHRPHTEPPFVGRLAKRSER